MNAVQSALQRVKVVANREGHARIVGLDQLEGAGRADTPQIADGLDADGCKPRGDGWTYVGEAAENFVRSQHVYSPRLTEGSPGKLADGEGSVKPPLHLKRVG